MQNLVSSSPPTPKLVLGMRKLGKNKLDQLRQTTKSSQRDSFTSLLSINNGDSSQRSACFVRDCQAPDSAELYN